MSRLTYGWLCWTDDPTMLSRDDGKWVLHDEPVREYLCALANAGVDEVRVLPWGVWGKRPHGLYSQFQPYEIRDGKFDLSAWNYWYFPIYRKFIEYANSYGLRVRFVWFDNCQLHGNFKNPWETNAQGITSFYGKDADAYTRTWIDRCIAEFAGLDVSWAFGNETNDPEFIGMARRVLIPAVRAHGLDPARLYYGATMTKVPWIVSDKYPDGAYIGPSTVQDLVRSEFAGAFGDEYAHKITREVHGCGVELGRGSMVDQAFFWWGEKPWVGDVDVSDDGTWNGEPNCDSEPTGATRPSARQWEATVKASRCTNFNYEHLPKGGDLGCQVNRLREIYRAIHGVYPPEKYIYVPLPPPVEYVDVPVCPVSEVLPNEYCPPAVTERFIKGAEPTAICTIHKKPKCSCWGWLWRGDFKRWWDCLFGDGPKKCKG